MSISYLLFIAMAEIDFYDKYLTLFILNIV